MLHSSPLWTRSCPDSSRNLQNELRFLRAARLAVCMKRAVPPSAVFLRTLFYTYKHCQLTLDHASYRRSQGNHSLPIQAISELCIASGMAQQMVHLSVAEEGSCGSPSSPNASPGARSCTISSGGCPHACICAGKASCKCRSCISPFFNTRNGPCMNIPKEKRQAHGGGASQDADGPNEECAS